jgi:hypothetical protein
MENRYCDSVGSLLAASTSYEVLEDYANQIQEIVRRSGGAMDGPAPLETATPPKLKNFLAHLNQPDAGHTPDRSEVVDWLFGMTNSESDLEFLVEAASSNETVSGRHCRIYGENPIRKTFALDPPRTVVIVAELDDIRYPKKFASAPYSYDPNVDYVTEL